MRFIVGLRSLEGVWAATSETGPPTSVAEMRLSHLDDGPECVSSRSVDDQEVRRADETHLSETRRCGGCDSDFLPTRRWSRFCSPACWLRTHRKGRHTAA